jgi:hypothetical protein
VNSAMPYNNCLLIITLLNVVVRKGAAILQLLAGENQTAAKLETRIAKIQLFNIPLLIRGNAFLILDLLLDILNGVRGFDLKSDGLAREGLNEDLHP